MEPGRYTPWVDPGTSALYPEPVAAAEKALVSLALYNPTVALAVNVPARSFFNPRLRAVWAAAIEVFERDGTCDPVTVGDHLQTKGKLDAVGGISYLSNCFILASDFGGPSLAPFHGEMVRAAYSTRELRRLASEIPGALDAGAGLPEVLDRVRNFIDTVETSGGEESCSVLGDEISLVHAKLAESAKQRAAGNLKPVGLVTGLGLERYVPGGLPLDKLTMLFGETGMFKTATKQWLADQVALSGRYVLDFSLEDSAELTAQRFLARHSGIPYGRIVTGEITDEEAVRLAELAPKVREAAQRIIVVGNVPSTIEEAVRLSRHWKRKVDLACVMVDYVQLMEMGQGNEATEIYRLCAVAQRAAHRDKVAWVLLSQMNRKFDARDDKRPQLGDLYGSSAMGQLCKLAIGVYRPSKYDPAPSGDSVWSSYYANAPGGREAYRGALELWIRKNVLGEADVMVPVLVDPPPGRFSEVTL